MSLHPVDESEALGEPLWGSRRPAAVEAVSFEKASESMRIEAVANVRWQRVPHSM